MSAATFESGYKLTGRLAALELPHRTKTPVRNADELLTALATYGLKPRGMYYAEPLLLRNLFWWQGTRDKTVLRWTAELVDRGEVTIEPLGRDCYGWPPKTVPVICIVRPQRFPRFANRAPIPQAVRELVYLRDCYRCVVCLSPDDLSLDHITPWSHGGSDHPDNLQTMCRPCNSRKGNRV